MLLVSGAVFTLLAAMAIHFQFTGAARLALFALVAAGAALFLCLWLRGASGWAFAVLVLGFAVAAAWWSTLAPSNERDWQPDVAHGVTATVTGDLVEVRNLRNFTWRTPDDFDAAWETRQYHLSALETVDVFTSVWGSPAIAHTLVSFGFAGGGQLVFSGEIRKEMGEAYSTLGGFFRKFDLVLIAADEGDIVRTRVDARGERVEVFRLDIPADYRRAVFLSLLDYGNELAVRPKFYNTLLANCTTVPFRLARMLAPGIPLDWRVLASGYLPEYLHDLGVLGPDPMSEIRARAVIARGTGAGLSGPAYSAAIREGRLALP